MKLKKSKYLFFTFIAIVYSFAVVNGQNTYYGTGTGTTGKFNSYFGYNAGKNTTGQQNTFVGHRAGYTNKTGNYNTYVGVNSGYYCTGSKNTMIGRYAGFNSKGSANVLIGYYAGYSESTSNKLYIDNSSTTSPLIWGDFANDILKINGVLNVNKSITLEDKELTGLSIDVENLWGGAHADLVGLSVVTGSRSDNTESTIYGIKSEIEYISDKPDGRFYAGYFDAGNIVHGGDNAWNIGIFARGGKYAAVFDGNVFVDRGKLKVNNGMTVKNNAIIEGNVVVKGKVETKELKVTQTPTADFVFEENYNLPKLNEVENFINKNKHLPEIPSAKEMEANGVNIAEMNALLLQKIEELTLYTIEQQKLIEEQSERLKVIEQTSVKQ
jgi:hypothetical protein